MPEFDSLSDEYSGRLVFAKVSADASPEIASKYGVMGLPTLKFFCAGRPLSEIVGYVPRSSLKTRLDEMLSAHKDCLEHSSPVKQSR